MRLEGSEFEVDVGEGVIWNFDGEKGGTGKLHIQVIPKRVNMLVPKKFK